MTPKPGMKLLKKLDLSREEKQLRYLMSLRPGEEFRREQDKLHRMIAEKTLEYYCEDGYYAFYERYKLDYTTDDGYTVSVRKHSTKISYESPWGTLTGSGSTWDYIPEDLKMSPRPGDMSRGEYERHRGRMMDILTSEKVLYPFHPLHNIGHGYFDTQICMYGAQDLLRGGDK